MPYGNLASMSADELFREAINRLAESDVLFESYQTKLRNGDIHDEDGLQYVQVAHLRQTAQVYATLALIRKK